MATGRTALFFALALGATFLVQAPAALAARGWLQGPVDPWLGLAMLGIFMPLFAALIATRAEGGRMRDVFAPLARGRVHALWLLAALLLPGLLYSAAALLYSLAGGEGAALAYPPRDAQRIAALVLVPCVEELAWRGYALPRLVAAHGPARASLLLGVLWGAWHIPMLAIAGLSAPGFALAFVYFIAGSVVFTWFALRTRGALWAAIALHAGAHLNNSHVALPALTPLTLHTAAFVLCAVVLLAADRAPWQRRDAL